MPTRKKVKAKNESADGYSPTVRASISFPQEDYEQLEEVAGKKRVSLAWVVREAVRIYLKNQRGVTKAGDR